MCQHFTVELVPDINLQLFYSGEAYASNGGLQAAVFDLMLKLILDAEDQLDALQSL